jgi:methylated-DNA-[protein]-cysteine S-methyltransferase
MGTREAAAAIVIRTRLGWVAAAARDGRIVVLTLPRSSREAAARGLGIEADFRQPGDLLQQLAEDLRRYFAGEPVDFGRYEVDLAKQPRFLRRALMAARRIPYGQVRSYGWLAKAAGNPRAARAAGQAMARNPVPIIIPCHRVIAADGSLSGFGGGPEMKRALLELEGVRLP